MNSDLSDDLCARVWKAPAKLNLFLHVIGRKDNGYHLLQSVIQFIDLCDELRFDIRSDGVISVINSNQSIASKQDLVTQAAHLLKERGSTQLGVNIEVNKHIPLGAGLGGGSSDAATTLISLNQLWDCGLEKEELELLAKQVGADVPVFVRGQACWVEGIGDVLEPIILSEPWYLVVYPNVRLDTKHMFEDPNLTRNCHPIKISDFTQHDTKNVFEPIACSQPEVARAFQWLNQYIPARLTGSGSALFAVCDTQQQAEVIAERCPSEFIVYVVKGMNYSPTDIFVNRT